MTSPDYQCLGRLILLQTSPLIEQCKISYRSQMLETYFQKLNTPHWELHMMLRRRYSNKIWTVFYICIDFSIPWEHTWNMNWFSVDQWRYQNFYLPLHCHFNVHEIMKRRNKWTRRDFFWLIDCQGPSLLVATDYRNSASVNITISFLYLKMDRPINNRRCFIVFIISAEPCKHWIGLTCSRGGRTVVWRLEYWVRVYLQ